MKKHLSPQNFKGFSEYFLELVILFSAIILTNITAFSLVTQFPDYSSTKWFSWLLLVICLFALLFILIKFQSSFWNYRELWKKQFPLIFFIGYCLSSILWSTYIEASLVEFSLTLFATLVGSYLVLRYRPGKILDLVGYFAVFSIIASYLLLAIAPSYARLDNPQFLGAWRGIFWHRNHMGSLMAFFSSILLIKAFICKQYRWQFILNLFFFMLSAILVFGSRSATGILIFVTLTGFLVIVMLWLKYYKKLQRRHYLFIVLGLSVIVVLILSNLEFIFGLLGRNTTLTGRIPLWKDLITRVWIIKPVLGYGFGALWNQESFRVSMQTIHGWPYQVFFADNGFLDILLNTGIIGLFLFLIFFFQTGFRTVKVFLRDRQLISVFPMLIFVYVLLANISYSFLLEVDQFVWMLLVIAGFSSIVSAVPKISSANKINSPHP